MPYLINEWTGVGNTLLLTDPGSVVTVSAESVYSASEGTSINCWDLSLLSVSKMKTWSSLKYF